MRSPLSYRPNNDSVSYWPCWLLFRLLKFYRWFQAEGPYPEATLLPEAYALKPLREDIPLNDGMTR